jgi:hypothetical protein
MNNMTSGLLEFSVGSVSPVRFADNQIFTIPFTATGRIQGPYHVGGPDPICPIPNLTQFTCYEFFPGSGNLQVIVGYASDYPIGSSYGEAYYIKDALFTFIAPEPSTLFMLGLVTLGLPVYRRYRSLSKD